MNDFIGDITISFYCAIMDSPSKENADIIACTRFSLCDCTPDSVMEYLTDRTKLDEFLQRHLKETAEAFAVPVENVHYISKEQYEELAGDNGGSTLEWGDILAGGAELDDEDCEAVADDDDFPYFPDEDFPLD